MAIAAHPSIANRSHANGLPGSWGTLYELTQLGDDLPTAIEAGEVRPDMTRRTPDHAPGVFVCQDSSSGRPGRCGRTVRQT